MFQVRIFKTSTRFIFPFPAMSVYRSVVLIDAVSLMEFIFLLLQAKLIKETRVLLAPLQTKIDSFSRTIANSTENAFFVWGFLWQTITIHTSISIHIYPYPSISIPSSRCVPGRVQKSSTPLRCGQKCAHQKGHKDHYHSSPHRLGFYWEMR